MRERLLSVIIPVYNAQKCLTKCLNSIIRQTYTNIEVLVIDDGSTDKSALICDEFAKKDNRVKVIHLENRGVSSARNMGIKMSQGKYVTFVDADDYIEPKMYEVLINDLESNNADIAMCNSFSCRDKMKFKLNRKMKVYSGIEMLDFFYDDNYAMIVVLWNKVYKRECFRGVVFPEGITREDEFVMHSIIYNAKQVTYRKQGFYHYILNKESITRRKDMGRVYRLYAVENRLNFFKEKSMTKLYYLSLLRLLNDSVRCYLYIRIHFNDMQVLDSIRARFDKYYIEFTNMMKYFQINKIHAPFIILKCLLIKVFHMIRCKEV